ncbi:MAG TPA: sugar nucleotide-binding protein [Candidatus Gracilibacteria bacterium]
MKILLLGHSGLLGSEFFKILDSDKKIQLLAPSHASLDLLDFERVQAYLRGCEPDLIVHCVAYTDVEKAESEPEACRAINVGILGNILKANIPIIHFSTDYVFNVKDHTPINEDRTQSAINQYGASKKEVEEVLQSYSNTWYNIRTSWLFGEKKANFITKILDKALIHDRLQVVDDQIGRPTYAKDLAAFVVEHFVHKFTSHQVLASGHYHLQNSGDPVSWAGLADFVIKTKGLKTTIESVDSDHYPTKAKRPKNSILGNTKLPTMRPWTEAVEEYLSEVNS